MRLRDEYVQLLSQQLESQRQYFTSKLNRLELEAQAQVTALMDDIETNRKMADSLQLQVSHHEGEAETLKTDVAALEAELKAQLAALTAMRQVCSRSEVERAAVAVA